MVADAHARVTVLTGWRSGRRSRLFSARNSPSSASSRTLVGVAALYLGKQEGKELRYMGKVGTGWTRTKSAEIRKALDTVVSPKQKLTKPIKKPKATWVEPKFYADVEYRDITSEGLLRASSFKGLSRDKS